MGNRTYYRDSRGRFHGSSGAASSGTGRAGGFAKGGGAIRGRMQKQKPARTALGQRLKSSVKRTARSAVRSDAVKIAGVVVAGNLAARGVQRYAVKRTTLTAGQAVVRGRKDTLLGTRAQRAALSKQVQKLTR